MTKLHAHLGPLNIPISHVVKERLTATITVSGIRAFSFRFRVGLFVMRFAAWVLPFKTEVKIND